ncbi:hypothetical protein C8R43DRAFT_1016963 [Mycena crocata]|nr:hypothetical protein C8R43DRAFT_1016963 [Mycena crocata]
MDSEVTLPLLVEACIYFLYSTSSGNSISDLLACSLVSRSWVYAAQSCLFTQVTLSRDELKSVRMWTRLRETLIVSPHLIRHIRRLHVMIFTGSRLRPTLSEICNFPFTHLERVTILRGNSPALKKSAVTTLRPLLRLPTLRRIDMCHDFTNLHTFGRLWRQCSPGIGHVELSSRKHSFPDDFSHVIPGTVLTLESLRLSCIGPVGSWLGPPASTPFDLSRLKVLSIGEDTSVLWDHFSPQVRSVEALDLFAQADELVDLSLFPHLALLRMWIYLDALPTALETLSTIVPANRLRRIIISPMFIDTEHCQELDYKLWSLPLQSSTSVELEMNKRDYDLLVALFPRLRSKNMLKRTPIDTHWFDNFTRT